MNQQYVTVEYNNVILRSTIEASIGGVYRSVVRTSAGEVNVTIVLNVECEWSKTCVCLAVLISTNIHVVRSKRRTQYEHSHTFSTYLQR